MKFDRETEAFIKEFVQDISEKNVAIFAGAGLSRDAGFVNWSELLKDIADELGLDVDKEHDLISLAQYHVNENGGRAKVNKKILEEFAEQAEQTENHKVLSRLPITTFWTTNYDTLIEDSLKEAHKIVDLKHDIDQLAVTRQKRDAVVYKMHGDVHHASKAVLTKSQYESYYKTHEHFITALSGDLISKTFLFLGFSFTDPNLDYVLSRLNIQFSENMRQHYTFIRKIKKGSEDIDAYNYNVRKQELKINDLKRYKIKVLLVEEYSDVNEILKEIENRFKKNTVFISGSAEEYGSWGKDSSQKFIHLLSKKIITKGFRIVNGFGWGIGSGVINGSLEAIYEKPEKFSTEQLIVRPFPQFESGKRKLPELWAEYRHNMISLAGAIIFVFGNKRDPEGKIVDADGVLKEFDIANEYGLIPIPIPSTGYMANQIFEKVLKDSSKYYKGYESIIPLIESLSKDDITETQTMNTVIQILQEVNK